MKLTDDQENKVRELVESQGFKINTLKEDVIDHLCCLIESQLGKKLSFDELLAHESRELAPNGFIELEKTTVFLLNSGKILFLKKLIYLSGFISSVSITIGIAFKVLYLPGGYELFSFGFLTLFLIFIPLLALDKYKVAFSKAISERIKLVLGTSAGLIIGLSGLFKILHLQGADILLLLGVFVFVVGFLPFFFFTMYKNSVPGTG